MLTEYNKVHKNDFINGGKVEDYFYGRTDNPITLEELDQYLFDEVYYFDVYAMEVPEDTDIETVMDEINYRISKKHGSPYIFENMGDDYYSHDTDVWYETVVRPVYDNNGKVFIVSFVTLQEDTWGDKYYEGNNNETLINLARDVNEDNIDIFESLPDFYLMEMGHTLYVNGEKLYRREYR